MATLTASSPDYPFSDLRNGNSYLGKGNLQLGRNPLRRLRCTERAQGSSNPRAPASANADLASSAENDAVFRSTRTQLRERPRIEPRSHAHVVSIHTPACARKTARRNVCTACLFQSARL